MLVSIQEYARASQEQSVAYFRFLRAAGEAILKNADAFYDEVWHAIIGIIGTTTWGSVFGSAIVAKIQGDATLEARFDILAGSAANHSGEILGSGPVLSGKAYITNATTYALANMSSYAGDPLGPRYMGFLFYTLEVMIHAVGEIYRHVGQSLPLG